MKILFGKNWQGGRFQGGRFQGGRFQSGWFIASLVLGLTAVQATLAQSPGMNEQQMQQLMQQAQQMQACFANVDQQALMALGEKARAVESEVRTHCQAGRKAEALRTAVQFGQSISQDKNVQAARKCGEQIEGQMRGMMAGMMPNLDYPASEQEASAGICSGY